MRVSWSVMMIRDAGSDFGKERVASWCRVNRGILLWHQWVCEMADIARMVWQELCF